MAQKAAWLLAEYCRPQTDVLYVLHESYVPGRQALPSAEVTHVVVPLAAVVQHSVHMQPHCTRQSSTKRQCRQQR
jgi:hypothetical protein